MNPVYRSTLNRDVKLPGPGEFAPVQIGQMCIWPPVVLAPMAGVTNYPFRSVCSRFGAGLYVSEMINARPLVDGRDKTLKLADFGPDESPRSLQLYGSDPYYVSEAVKRLVNEGRIDHLDIVGVFQKIERDGLDRTFAGDRGNFILKFANVVHVDRRHYRNSGVEEFLDFLPPLGMPAPGRIRIRESVNDDHLRMPP